MTSDGTPWGEVVRVIDLAGVLANAVLGGIVARSARLDLVGFVVLAVLSGLGGGMVRDVLLQRGTVAALADPAYLALAVAGAVIAYLFPFRRRLPRLALTLLAAIAIGCWANVGAQKGLEAGLPWAAAVALGVITSISGGMVRDVVVRRVPTVFGGTTLSASSALLASAVTVACAAVGYDLVGAVAAILGATALSLAARRFRWSLPTEPPALGRTGRSGRQGA